MATIKHEIVSEIYKTEIELKTAKLFLDADLSVLGWQNPDYDEYAKRIWEEYSFYGWEGYCKGRIQVLSKMLEKERLFFTDAIREMLEDKARNNIKAEIERL